MITILDFLNSIIGTPLGFIMWACYELVSNFGWAIIIFTLIIKAAMFPLNLKQQKNMAKSQLFAPRMKEIQQKYKNNKEKQQEEMAKLQKEGYNPMGGCGTMVITMLLLFGVIDVVYKPFTHMEHLDSTQQGATETVKSIAKSTNYASAILASPEDLEVIISYKADAGAIKVTEANLQVKLEETFNIDDAITANVKTINVDDREAYGSWTDEQIAVMVASDSRLSNQLKTKLNTIKTQSNQLQSELFALQTYRRFPDSFNGSAMIDNEVIVKLDRLSDNMIFFGMDLGETPKLEWSPLVIIPIISFLFSLASMALSQWLQKKHNPDSPNLGGGMKAVLYIMPLFSLYIAFIVPAGVGFYWAISYLFSILQTVVTYKFWPPEKLRDKAQEQLDKNSIQYKTTATVVDIDEEGNEVEREERLSNLSSKDLKEFYRKKLEEARRKDAERYGDEEIPDLPPIEEKTDEQLAQEAAEKTDAERNAEEKVDLSKNNGKNKKKLIK